MSMGLTWRSLSDHRICMRSFLAFGLLLCLTGAHAQDTTPAPERMKLNAGIITNRLEESKRFYSAHLGFGVRFENDFYVLMHTPDGAFEISFLLPDHPSQQPIFQRPFAGEGMYLTIEVEDVDGLYAKLKQQGAPIVIELREEPWGDRHFAIRDPNGVGIDLVRYKAPEK